MSDVIQHSIVLNEFRYEWLVAVAPEFLPYAIQSDVASPIPYAVLVYRVDKQISENKWVYVFSGARINNLPNTRVQRTASGRGVRVWLANKIISLGWWLAGNGSR
jgi:hypothetical protein